MSPTDQQRLEVERIQNLVTGFGWKIGTINYLDGEIKIELSKEIEGPLAEETAGPG